MKLIFKIISVMALGLFGTSCLAQAPKGKLTYCSYSSTGAAGLGKDYCELIADPGKAPKVVVALNLGNRFNDPEIRAEYPVGQETVDSLAKLLAEAKVYKLNGYNFEEAITGGHSHRIYQEYDSGEKINARWYGNHVKQEAWAAYRMIEAFFAPWRTQATKENDPVVRFEIFAERVAGRGTDHFLLLAQNGSTPRVIYDLNIDSRFREEVHEQFDLETDEDLQKVLRLQQDLIGLKTAALGDYKKDDSLNGGTIYSVELNYASGARQSLYWHTQDVNPTAQATYNRIRAFFAAWVKER